MNAEALAKVHARAFDGQGRAWSIDEIEDLLQNPLVFATGDARSFAIGRVVADEAELLTLATDPDARRKGFGQTALTGFETEACTRGATRAFLEVAADNTGAQRLYAKSGYQEVTRRAAYYKGPDGARVDAIIMEKTLTPQQIGQSVSPKT